jgi:hypothetical protein
MAGKKIQELSGHSIRVGATQDLLELNIDLASVMQAGRWLRAAAWHGRQRDRDAIRKNRSRSMQRKTIRVTKTVGIARATARAQKVFGGDSVYVYPRQTC